MDRARLPGRGPLKAHVKVGRKPLPRGLLIYDTITTTMKQTCQAEALMKITRTFIFTAAAAAVFSTLATAGGPVLLALNTPVKETVKPVLISSATAASPAAAQVKPAEGDCTDFDALSAVDDPLYREGAKEMLKQVCENDAAAIAAAAKTAPVMRDAPNSKSRPAAKRKKPRAKKPAHADPVKS